MDRNLEHTPDISVGKGKGTATALDKIDNDMKGAKRAFKKLLEAHAEKYGVQYGTLRGYRNVVKDITRKLFEELKEAKKLPNGIFKLRELATMVKHAKKDGVKSPMKGVEDYLAALEKADDDDDSLNLDAHQKEWTTFVTNYLAKMGKKRQENGKKKNLPVQPPSVQSKEGEKAEGENERKDINAGEPDPDPVEAAAEGTKADAEAAATAEGTEEAPAQPTTRVAQVRMTDVLRKLNVPTTGSLTVGPDGFIVVADSRVKIPAKAAKADPKIGLLAHELGNILKELEQRLHQHGHLKLNVVVDTADETEEERIGQ